MFEDNKRVVDKKIEDLQERTKLTRSKVRISGRKVKDYAEFSIFAVERR